MENLEFQNLSCQECEDLNGGIVITGSMIAGAAIGAVIGAALTQDLDDLGDAFMDGYNAARE